jgi:hypothetical protein
MRREDCAREGNGLFAIFTIWTMLDYSITIKTRTSVRSCVMANLSGVVGRGHPIPGSHSLHPGLCDQLSPIHGPVTTSSAPAIVLVLSMGADQKDQSSLRASRQ